MSATTAIRRAALVALASSVLLSPVGVRAHGGQHESNEPPVILAPGYTELSFDAPVPGTYDLPRLGSAANATVLDANGAAVQLGDLIGEKLTLMSFIFTTCDDVNGCPLATFVMSQVAKRIHADPALAQQVRFISLSFDPLNDTPSVMKTYSNSFRPDGADWRFLTCENEAVLQPILADYGQSIAKEFDAEGNETGNYSHILRVYLIDRDAHIRNIYSVSFLHADTIVNDLKTLLANDSKPHFVKTARTPDLHGAGDDKSGYENDSYTTRSAHLPNRSGVPQDLLALSNPPPLGLPPVPVPVDNPLTAAKVTLGRKIFFDRRLSINRTISCAMCHVPEQGFAHNELATAVGVEGRTVRRNSPTIYNIGYMRQLFHDARDDSLEHQIWQPLLARNEMANPSVSAVVNKLKNLPDYRGLFEEAFGGESPTIENIGKAIASYERTLVSGDSPFDRWHFGREDDAVDEAVKRGYAVFSGKGRCSSCHLIDESFALFTDHQVHNTGVGYERAMQPTPTAQQRVLLAPGIEIAVDADAVADSAERPPGDLGYYEITQNPADRWKYRTPTLRNVALTAPYMHDGSLATLEAVVDFYNRGGVRNEGLDPLIQPLDLNAREKADLVALLQALTGSNVDKILTDAFSAPVGNHQDTP